MVLALVAGIVAMGLLIAAALLVYSRADDALRAQARARVRGTAALGAQLVGEQTMRFSELAQTYAATLGSLSDRPIERLPPAEAAVVNRELRALSATASGLHSTGLISPEGRLIIAQPPVPQYYGQSFADRDWYRGVTLERSPHVSRVFLAKDGQRTVTVAARVRAARSGRVIAILTVALQHRTQELADAFARSQGIRLTVTDQSGSVVARSGETANRLVSMQGDPRVLAALQGRSSSGERHRDLAASAPVPVTGWTVSADLPTSVAFADVYTLRTLLIIVVFVLGALLAALTAGLVIVLHRGERTQRAAADRFRGLLESAPDATVIVSEAGEIMLVNDQMVRLSGYEREELIGRDVELLIPQRHRAGHVLRRSGFFAHPSARPMGAELELQAVRKDGSELPVEISLGPLDTEQGTLVSAAVRDVTARVEAESELRLQGEIMRNMAEGVVLVRANDWTIAYANPKFEEMFGYASGELTGRPVEVVNAPTERDPREVAGEIQAALSALGVWSGEVHNIKKDGTTFWCQANVSNFDHPDWGVVSVAVHTDITERKEAEEERLRLASIVAAADTLQQSILGPVDHELPGTVAARYQPAVRPLEVGGDWYDVVKLGAGRLGLIVGDCVGRGVGAAAVMGQLRSVSHSLMLQGKTPREVLSDLDTFAQRIPRAHCTTVFCALLDPAERTVRYSSVGHPPAILAHRDGSSELLERANSVPLAVGGVERNEATAELSAGCTLALYTDGLVERRDEPMDAGLDRLTQIIERHHDRSVQSLASAIIEEMQPERSVDDVALLLHRLPLYEPPRFTRSITADPANLAELRKELRAWLDDVGHPDAVDDILLSVCEACSNSIEHAYRFDQKGTVEIRAEIEASRLIVTVADAGRWKVPDPAATQRGRGLSLVKAVVDDFTIETGSRGTTVHLHKDLKVD
jgi:PAS domain S-box-containing protein